MDRNEIKKKILEILDADFSKNGNELKSDFAEGFASLFVENESENKGDSIELKLDKYKNIKHRERQLSSNETLVLMNYRYIHKSSKGRGRGRYYRNSSRWRIKKEIKQSSKFVYIMGTDGIKILSSKLPFNNYSLKYKKKSERGFKFVKYAIAIIEYTGEGNHEKDLFNVKEMKMFKVTGVNERFNGCNIQLL